MRRKYTITQKGKGKKKTGCEIEKKNKEDGRAGRGERREE